jgi:hypothetical protein
MIATELTAEAAALIDRLQRNAAVRRGRDGSWEAGRDRAPADAGAMLERAGLATAEGDTLLLTPAGRRWRAPPRTTDRAIGSGTAPDGRRPARSVRMNQAESALTWLAARGLISATQLQAGERLRADWTRAQLDPTITMNWDAAPGRTGPRGPAEPLGAGPAQIAAKRRFEAAVQAAGPGLADMLWRVVCDGTGLEAAERAMRWPPRSGRVVLALALDRLAAHYGMTR